MQEGAVGEGCSQVIGRLTFQAVEMKSGWARVPAAAGEGPSKVAGHSASVSAYSSGGQESDLGWQGCHPSGGSTLGAACMPWLPAPSSASQASTVASSKPSLRALLPLPTHFSDPDPPASRSQGPCDHAGPWVIQDHPPTYRSLITPAKSLWSLTCSSWALGCGHP